MQPCSHNRWSITMVINSAYITGYFIQLFLILLENLMLHNEISYLFQLALHLLRRLLFVWFFFSYTARILVKIRLQCAAFCLTNLVHRSMQWELYIFLHLAFSNIVLKH
jgi:hypothetical protein